MDCIFLLNSACLVQSHFFRFLSVVNLPRDLCMSTNKSENQELEALIQNIISKEALFSATLNMEGSAGVETVEAWGAQHPKEMEDVKAFSKGLISLFKIPDLANLHPPERPNPPESLLRTNRANLLYRAPEQDWILYNRQFEAYNKQLEAYNKAMEPLHAYQNAIIGVLLGAQKTMKTKDKKSPEKLKEEAAQKERFLAYLKKNPAIAHFLKANITKLNAASDSFLKFANKTQQEYAEWWKGESYYLRQEEGKDENPSDRIQFQTGNLLYQRNDQETQARLNRILKEMIRKEKSPGKGKEQFSQALKEQALSRPESLHILFSSSFIPAYLTAKDVLDLAPHYETWLENIAKRPIAEQRMIKKNHLFDQALISALKESPKATLAVLQLPKVTKHILFDDWEPIIKKHLATDPNFKTEMEKLGVHRRNPKEFNHVDGLMVSMPEVFKQQLEEKNQKQQAQSSSSQSSAKPVLFKGPVKGPVQQKSMKPIAAFTALQRIIEPLDSILSLKIKVELQKGVVQESSILEEFDKLSRQEKVDITKTPIEQVDLNNLYAVLKAIPKNLKVTKDPKMMKDLNQATQEVERIIKSSQVTHRPSSPKK